MSTVMRQGRCPGPKPPNTCSKAQSKEIQIAPLNKFECFECHTRLLPPIKPNAKLPIWIAAGVSGIAILGTGSYFLAKVLIGPGEPRCEEAALQQFFTTNPPADSIVTAGDACVAQAKTPDDVAKLAMAARLFRQAADAGNPSGALRLGELYDPNKFPPEPEVGLPPDSRIAFDNYLRAFKLGNAEASSRLSRLKPFVERARDEGDREAVLLLERWPQ